MPEHQGVKADVHVYVVPGVVDASVVATQAQRRLDKAGHTTYVHHHRKDVLTADGIQDSNCKFHEHDEYGSVTHS